MRTSGHYSALAIVTESATITCLWQRLKGRQEDWESFIKLKKGEGFRYVLIGSCWSGKAGGRLLEIRGILCDWFAEHTGFP